MAKGDRLSAGILRRIAASGKSLTVHYPVARPVALGPAEGRNAPLSPLSGPPEALSAIPAAPVPSQPPVTLQCLWTDLSSVGLSASGAYLGRNAIQDVQVGLSAKAECLARVTVADAVLDPANPYGDTVFTACERVEFGGRYYRVVGVRPVDSGFRAPDTLYVWVVGAEKQ